MTASGGDGVAETGGIGRPGPSWPGSGRPQAAAPSSRVARTSAEPSVAGLPLATFWRRALGFALDTAVLVGFFAIVAGVAPALTAADGGSLLAVDPVQVVLDLLVQVAYYWLWNSIGWSPGKRLLRMRIVVASGGRPGIERGLGRTVISLLSRMAFLLGYVWALWDSRRQTWHDKVAGTYVVVLPPAGALGSRSSEGDRGE